MTDKANKPTEFPHIVIKPWGREVWLALNDKYCMKLLYLKAGTRTSLQHHEYKLETTFMIKGEAKVLMEFPDGRKEEKIFSGGDILNFNYEPKDSEFYGVTPMTIHRVTAITDAIYMEASTPEVDDVIRHTDDYERSSGRIESEHKK